jgi:hypothetical protein
VVRVSKRLPNNFPRFVPLDAFFINQDPHELHDRHRRMGIVQLDRIVLVKLCQRYADLLEPAHNVRERGRTPKVLLLQAEFFPAQEVVVGVEHARDVLGFLGLGYCAVVVPGVERLQVERAYRPRLPESDVVGVLCVIPWLKEKLSFTVIVVEKEEETNDGKIKGNSQDVEAACPLPTLAIS